MNATRTIWKAYATEAGAQKFIAKHLTHIPSAEVKQMGGTYYVVSD